MRRARGLFPELFAMHQVPYTDIGSLAHGPMIAASCTWTIAI